MTEKYAELKDRLVVGHKSDGRSIYDEGAKKELIVACLKPGASVARMAMQHGVNANLLRTWITTHQRRSIQGSTSAPFVAVQVVAERDHSQRVPQRKHEDAEPAASHLPVTAVAVMAEQPSLTAPTVAPTIGLTVRLPNGVRFDLGETSLQELPTLVQMLSRLQCSASTKD